MTLTDNITNIGAVQPVSMKLKLICCEILYREMCAAISRSPHQVDVEFLSKGLHDLGGTSMQERLQEAVNQTDKASYDAILLGYALCGNGLLGLTAITIPLVIPRAHDCITLLLGNRHRYLEYFENHPGVYFRSTGWIERGGSLEQARNPEILKKVGISYNIQELIEQYGEDNGRYLYEEFTRSQQHYRQLTYIETGLEPDGRFEESARQEAERRGWHFEIVQGDLRLFDRLVAGDWDGSDFLVVPPGYRVKASYDADIIKAEEAGT